MASSKRIGFFWGEEKITIVEFDKNTPLQVVSSPLGSKAGASSPFSSNLTEEIQITAILQKMLQDNKITGGSFYVSLPMKEIILRSFIIPFVKKEDIQNAIKFEAKKYMPFDIQDLSFVYHTIPFSEGQSKRLQVIFFAARKEILARYERIFKQVKAEVSYCEPYMVSLTKSLFFKKAIKPTDHLAFLILDQNLGRICFIDQGIPQFIREFPISAPAQSAETDESKEALNLKIVNEVGNSFDFYARQFSGDRIEQVLVSSEFVQQDLMNTLETELKVKITKFSPAVMTGVVGPSNDMDAIYAMGACVAPPIDVLSAFNFLGGSESKHVFQSNVDVFVRSYKEIIYVFMLCVFLLAGIFIFFQMQLKVAQKKYDQLSSKQGSFSSESIDSVKAELQQNSDLLTKYKNIRASSAITFIMLRVASHLPQGVSLSQLRIKYDEGDSISAHVTIEMRGQVYKKDANEEIAVVDQVFSDFKNDKELATYIKSVSLLSLNREVYKDKQVTGFNISCH